MGLTHDYRDVSRDRRRATPEAGAGTAGAPTAVLQDREQLLAIPHILRRRARWVGARLRHSSRSD
ncbi:hypothetical protein POF50_010580 [Streptomyces sp. SL13]|uniref:Uncharacterized protein n=1 Tax=Streptantibioticus silvisoli TaxID=2705255 RepID=A0AA90K8R8_9ACTN|nr:hypothetical protein [Streptantibioticus silvisoli]MDI5969777.1 hypothetical protein [Streptantibioticus silvisoli]